MRDGHALARAAIFLTFGWQLVGATRTFTRLQSGPSRVLGMVAPIAFLVLYFATGRTEVWSWGLIPGLLGLIGALILFECSRRAVQGRLFSYIMMDDAPGFVFTGGPFARIRHPFYASYLIAFASSAILFPSWITFGVVIAMVVYFNFVAAWEERKFERTPLAAEYAQYKRRTGRFLPF